MISIVIPVYNESHSVSLIINMLVSLEGSKELIIVDGGSTDDTVAVAQTLAHTHHNNTDIQIVESPLGRATQMNVGAFHANGNVLWFIHADSRVHPHSLRAIQQAIDNGTSYGALQLCFYDTNNIVMALIAIGSRMRAKYRHILFGDQAIFMSKTFFKHTQGFPLLPIMEDYAWSKYAKYIAKPTILAIPIGTSARRFLNKGIIKTFCFMQKMQSLYNKGVDINILAKKYREWK